MKVSVKNNEGKKESGYHDTGECRRNREGGEAMIDKLDEQLQHQKG